MRGLVGEILHHVAGMDQTAYAAKRARKQKQKPAKPAKQVAGRLGIGDTLSCPAESMAPVIGYRLLVSHADWRKTYDTCATLDDAMLQAGKLMEGAGGRPPARNIQLYEASCPHGDRNAADKELVLLREWSAQPVVRSRISRA